MMTILINVFKKNLTEYIIANDIKQMAQQPVSPDRRSQAAYKLLGLTEPINIYQFMESPASGEAGRSG